jgi:PHD/YefM family antitoxin component YafN of YafNO toxin-antitoxin module
MTSPRIISISAFRELLTSIDVSVPVIVTQKGEPLYVVQSPAQYEEQQEQLALLRSLSFAEQDVEAKRTLTSEQLRECLVSDETPRRHHPCA